MTEGEYLQLPKLAPHPVAAVVFFIGAALATSFLHASNDWWVVGLAALGCTAAWAATGLSSSKSSVWLWIGFAAWAALLGFYALCTYLVVAFGALLAWTMPAWTWALVAAAAVAWAATLRRPRHRLHVPPVLAFGICIAALLNGWLREEQLLRCDDYLALRPPVELIFPTPPNLASCRPGEVRPAGRFARTIWEAPDGKRLILTTQGEAVPGGLDGSVCEARLGTDAQMLCVGPPYNKSQGVIDLPDSGRLLVMQWGVRTPSASLGSVILELPREGPFELLQEHWFDDEMMAEGFYEPRNSILYMFSDRMNGIHRAVLPSFERLPTLAVDVPTPGELRYDRQRGEGVACGDGVGDAIRGDPFSVRRFADANSSLLDRASVSWGCDWDPIARKVYSTVPNLGLLDRIDYDTGRVEKHWFVGLGMRSVAYDRARRRVYFTNFLRGEVLAFDERSERVTNRWFVGRFSRWVQLTRDGRALLATGNLGIVRIPLDEQAL